MGSRLQRYKRAAGLDSYLAVVRLLSSWKGQLMTAKQALKWRLRATAGPAQYLTG
jgi:hypothetical protein